MSRAAMIMSAAALIMSAGFAGGPALARAIASNSDKVDGLHAVKASATKAKAKGKLVATDPTTAIFPSKFIGNDVKFPVKAPVGVTLAGTWGFDVQAASTGGDYGGVIDFEVRLPSTPTVVFSSAGTAVTHCPGSVAAPAADPGYACLYLGFSGGVDTASFFGNAIYPSGIYYHLSGTASAGSDVYAIGTWAVTTSAATPSPRTSTGIGK